jgi:hypothetical protein
MRISWSSKLSVGLYGHSQAGQAQMPKRQQEGNGVAQAGDLVPSIFFEGLISYGGSSIPPTLGLGFPGCHILSEFRSAVPVSAGVPDRLRGCGP